MDTIKGKLDLVHCKTDRREYSLLLTVIGGMAVRRWWFQLMPETRRRYADVAWEYRKAINIMVTTGLGLIGAFLSCFMELDPWTDLWRLFIFSERTIEINADKQVAIFLSKMSKCCLLDTEHPLYNRVAGVTSRLLSANTKVDAIRNRQWSVVVVDNPMINAFVMANGFIFVFSGLAAVANDDQLSIIVGHELAHCMLRHLNHYKSVNLAFHVLCMLPVSAVFSIVLPFSQALLAVMLCQLVLYVCVGLTRQRSHEIEADRVGLELAANACVDVTQGYRFWETMTKINGPSNRIWWLQTHPTEKSRARHLYRLIPEATELQKLAGC